MANRSKITWSSGSNHIDKQNFITLDEYSYTKALSAANICNGFAVQGLVSFDPQHVLDKLVVKKTTPPSSSHGPWTAKKP